MRFHIEHETRYRFSKPVFLEPHLVRLCPSANATQHLETFTLDVSPRPAGVSVLADACGNTAHSLWFQDQWDELVIRTTCLARTTRANPYDYLLAPTATSLPVPLSPNERLALAPCLTPSASPEAARLADTLRRQTQGDPVGFLHAANDWLHRHVAITSRNDPGLQSPQTTLNTRQGACRDVSLAFMDLCRHVGLPARYVSCYQAGDPDQTDRDLHAFAEAYLPGAGWRGFDPTLGLAVADHHLALCASPHPEDTAPVTGSFRGDDATASLCHRIVLEILG